MPRYVTDLYEIDFCNETNKYKVRNAKSKDSLFTTDTLERAEMLVSYLVHYPLLKRSKDD